MRVTLAQLEAFFWVARLGSVQLAAGELSLAQPTVSLRIRDLEQSLRHALFERAGRGMRLTEAGQRLLERAAVILDEVGKIRSEAVAEIGGRIRIGFAEGFAMVCLAPFLKALHRDHPSLRPELFVATSSALEGDMTSHRLDLAFLVKPVGQPGLRLQPLGAQPTAWAAAPDAWTLPARIRPADLKQIPIITNPPPSAMYRQIVDWFSSAAIEPARLDICTSVTMVAHLVSSGVGLGLLPIKMIEPQIAAGSLRILHSVPEVESGQVYAAFWEGRETPAVDAALRCMRQVLGTMDYLVAEH